MKGGTAVAIAFAIIFAFGLVLGYSISKLFVKQMPLGVLRIDESDPDGPYIFLELSTDPRIIKQNRYVTLEVNATSYISQK